MVRSMSFLLAFWLAALFVVGQSSHTPQFLVWCNGFGAAFALFGALISQFSPAWLRLAGPVALSAGLLVAAFAQLEMGGPIWSPACTLMGAGVYLAIVVAEWVFAPRNRGTMAPADS